MEIMTNRMTLELRRLHFEHHDNCISCGYQFIDRDTTHLGYDKDKNPIYVCDKCKHLLKETAVRYSFSKRPYEIPANSTILWRYMDFTKYIALISKKCLYFARADQFDDPFEGAQGVLENKSSWESKMLLILKYAILTVPEQKILPSHEKLEMEANRLLKDMELSNIKQRRSVFINCWHANEHESEAMWRLYSKHLDYAIAIKTTYHKLYAALGKDPDIEIGKVNYLDLRTEYAAHRKYWTKRKSFEHEMEVRALIHDYRNQNNGIEKSCNLSLLIDSIYISPSAPDWFTDLVSEVTIKYGLSINMKKSDLLACPFF